MAPPAKRQKRLLVLSSDEDDDDDDFSGLLTDQDHDNIGLNPPPAPNSTTNQSLPTRSRNRAISTAGQTGTDTSFKKATRNPKPATKKSTAKPVSLFFDASNRSQRSSRRPSGVTTSEVEDELEDIEDDSPQGDLQKLQRSNNHTQMVVDRQKGIQEDKLQNGSQRFKLGGNARSHSTQKPVLGQTADSRPWAGRYGPINLDELAVHKKKVSDVRKWLESTFQGRNRKRLLVLKGPSGAGKTATVSTLAKVMGIELAEWRNPVGSEYSSEGYLSMSAQFDEFIGRSGRFGRLDLSDNIGKTMESPISDRQEQDTRRKIILLEEFPNTFLSTSSALRLFRSSVLEYLAISIRTISTAPAKEQGDSVTPLIMVITETRLTTTTAASDSFTAHRLLGSEILSHPAVSVIDFNPIAPTLISKALDLVIQKEAKQSGRRRMPGSSVLRALGEAGDVRNAIGSLEFLYLRGEDGDDWCESDASRAKKGANSLSTFTNMKKKSLEMVTQRESSLGLFHAVGKVVYNKRDDATKALIQPPNHISEHARTRVPQVSVDHLIDETGTDTETFIAALHENFVLSCEGTSSVETINNCLEVLSDSDILGAPRSGRASSRINYGGHSSQGAASDSLRQDEICFQLAVRGLLFTLPDPVKRRAHPVAGKRGAKNDSYKMFYPTSMRLLRQMEEIDIYINQSIDRLRTGVFPSKQSLNTRDHQFAETRSNGKVSRPPGTEDCSQKEDQEGLEPPHTALNFTKAELILERLPYVARIGQQTPASSDLRRLKKITQFLCITDPHGETSEDDDTDEPLIVPEWTTDLPVDLKAECSTDLQQSARQAKKGPTTHVSPTGEEVEKMYLSDDDIED